MSADIRKHEFEPVIVDCVNCCAGCVVDICKNCGQAADSDDWTEFCTPRIEARLEEAKELADEANAALGPDDWANMSVPGDFL